jgi:hypothetical protein
MVRATWMPEALCLELGIRLLGTADEHTWTKNLEEALPGGFPTTVTEASTYLGQLVAWVARVTDETAPQAACAALSVAQQFLREMRLQGRARLFDASGVPDRVALFYTETDNEPQIEHFLRGALLETGLFVAKIDHHYRQYWHGSRDSLGTRDSLRASERKLAGILHALAQPAGLTTRDGTDIEQSLHWLQSRIHEVAGAYGEFAATLSAFQALQHSVDINIANLESCVRAYALPPEGLLAALRNDMAGKVSQLRVDGGFYDVRVREAEMAQRSLQGQAEILRARLEAKQSEQLGDNIHHIKMVQTFLHYLEYVLVSVYFGHLVDMVFVHPTEGASHEKRQALWSINWPVLGGFLFGLAFAFLLDPMKKKIWQKLTGWFRIWKKLASWLRSHWSWIWKKLTGPFRKHKPD